jgi:S1-C subfamily serine protease
MLDPEGPADTAGLRVGDIVTTVNNRGVGSVRQLQSVISSMLPGETARLAVWRPEPDITGGPGEAVEISVVLGRLDYLRTRGELPANQSEEHILPLGIARMATSTRRLASDSGMEYRQGVLIQEVVVGSELAEKIDAPVIVTEINGRPIADTQAFVNELRQYDLRAMTHGRRDLGGYVRATVHLADGGQETIVLRVPPN